MVVSSCVMWPETVLHHSPIWEVSVHLTSTLHLASISPLSVLFVLSVSQYHLCLFQCHIFCVCVSLSLSAHLVPPSLPLHPSACLPSLYIRCFVFVLTFRFIQFRQLLLSYVYYFRVIYIKGLNLLFVCKSKKSIFMLWVFCLPYRGRADDSFLPEHCHRRLRVRCFCHRRRTWPLNLHYDVWLCVVPF